MFSIAPKADQPRECYGSPEYSIDDSGDLLVKDSLYTHLDRPQAQFDEEQAVCDYDVTVTDETADVDQSTQIDAKIKILLVYEHIIISLDEPPDQVKMVVAGIVRCLADIIPEYVLFVEDVRAYLLRETQDSSLIQPRWTDVWFYAVNVKTKEFAKFWEFKSALDATPGWILCIPDYLNIRRPSNIYYTEVSYAGFALLAVAGLIAMSGLLCMFALFLSWDRMQADKARLALQTGKVNLAYEAESTADVWLASRPASILQPRLSVHSTGSVEKAKIMLWETESQELTMEMFNETDDFDKESDEVALIPPKSPTEVHILVGNENDMPFVTLGQWESDNDAETNDRESSDETSFSGQSEEIRDDTDEVKGYEEIDGGQMLSSNPVKGLITFFEPESTDDNLIIPPPTPPPHPRVPTPPPPPFPTPTGNQLEVQDEEFPKPPEVTKPVVFKNKEGDTIGVVLPSTEL
ncbi:uncharacterized protein [Amphiura filiformis]|uniref:uncharacterized protein n=1 Tax=Amphiura filiformis TaxID=82378 RepID=UPI003B2251B3